MSEELLVRSCAPTLAGLKTANLFNCPYTDAEEIKSAARKYNKILVKKGLRVLPLKMRENRALIYVYRPSRLSCATIPPVICSESADIQSACPSGVLFSLCRS